MSHQAKSAFTIDLGGARPMEGWEGGKMSRARWAKVFTGELAGKSVVEVTMLGLDDGGPSIYVGIERFDCTLNGRQGTFVLIHAATAHGNQQSTSWTIASGSGTGQLAGISGHAEILPNHDFVLHYDLSS